MFILCPSGLLFYGTIKHMLKTESLYFSYEDRTPALNNINFELRKGDFLALLGANGCGKTTLLKHLNGLLKPSSGKVFLNGLDIAGLNDLEIFSRVGMVFQDPNDQLFNSTAEQDIAFGPINMGLSKEDILRRTTDALQSVGALKFKSKAIHTLSFGEKRRISLAGILAMEPDIILLDEPTSGLDPRGTSSIMNLLRRINKEKGTSIIMATHDVELVPLFTDRVIIMSKGRIICEGTPEQIFSDTDMIRNAALRLPRIGHLIEILRKEDCMEFHEMPLTIGEARRELLRFKENHLPSINNEIYHKGASSIEHETNT